jgi:hypothetical protein
MEISILRQAVSFSAAMLILVAYVGHQMHWMDSRKASYNILNAAGSAVLAYIALRPFQAGFVVLEGVWTVVSLFAWIRGWRQATNLS